MIVHIIISSSEKCREVVEALGFWQLAVFSGTKLYIWNGNSSWKV